MATDSTSSAARFQDSLTRGRNGDRQAVEELFARWRPLLRLLARRQLGAELSARVDPSDVVQEACVQAFRDLPRFRGQTEGEWVAWLRTIVQGQAAMARRHHRAARRDLAREDRPTQDLVSRAEPRLDADELARLAAAVDSLPHDMREVVIRRIFDQEPFDALAASLGRSSVSARVLWTRALHRLRERLEGPGER